MAVEMKDIVAPKWMMATKRGWGMVIAGLSAGLPMFSWWLAGKGINVDLPMITLFGETVSRMLDSVGLVVGFVLWVWGSMRPTAPITVLPPAVAPFPPNDLTPKA